MKYKKMIITLDALLLCLLAIILIVPNVPWPTTNMTVSGQPGGIYSVNFGLAFTWFSLVVIAYLVLIVALPFNINILASFLHSRWLVNKARTFWLLLIICLMVTGIGGWAIWSVLTN